MWQDMDSFNILSHSIQTMFRSVSQLIGMPSFCKYMLHFYAVHSIIDYTKMLNPVKCSIINEAGTIGHDAFAACMDITI